MGAFKILDHQDIARSNFYWYEIKIRINIILSLAILAGLVGTLFYW